MELKRRLARWVPGLSQIAGSLDRLEDENRQLRRIVADLSRLHTVEGIPAQSEDGRRAADGFPIPPAALQYWVTGSADDSDGFLALGELAADAIVRTLARQELTVDDLRAVLDFGCGCGRVIRHLARCQHLQLHGSDYNRPAITWCDEHLPFAEFGTNRLEPPTRYRDSAFDLVYAFSVFTHLTGPLQRLWMDEMHRIVRPRGYLIISVHGASCLDQLSDGDRDRFVRGELVVIHAEHVGQNACGAFHPEHYVREVLAADFEVLEFLSRGALGNPPQDLYLLRRPAS